MKGGYREVTTVRVYIVVNTTGFPHNQPNSSIVGVTLEHHACAVKA